MGDTMTVEIPADVKDNSQHHIRIQWRNVRDATEDEILSGKHYLTSFGYTLHQWDDEDKNGTRVTLHRFVNREGQTVDLYATYYYTRVACNRCDTSYASAYVVIELDGVPERSKPEPLCGNHHSIEQVRVNRARREGVNVLLYRSEWLNIGQHD